MTWVWLIVEWVVIVGGLFLFAFFANKKRKIQSQIYSIIVDSDSETIPIQNIMSALQMEFSAVLKDLKAMSINGNYPLLKNSHVDIGKQILVLSRERLEKQRRKNAKINKKQSFIDDNVIECKHCGAKNKKGAANECEYCGSPL